jgi:hypothetical protein
MATREPAAFISRSRPRVADRAEALAAAQHTGIRALYTAGPYTALLIIEKALKTTGGNH